MVHIVDFKGEHVFLCDSCTFHYRDQRDAEACERHCNTHAACSEEITGRSIERSPASDGAGKV